MRVVFSLTIDFVMIKYWFLNLIVYIPHDFLLNSHRYVSLNTCQHLRLLFLADFPADVPNHLQPFWVVQGIHHLPD